MEAQGWAVKTVMGFLNGIDQSTRPDQIGDGALVDAKNLRHSRGLVQVDQGISAFLGTVRGTPQAGINAEYGDKTSELVLVTTATAYRKPSYDQWQYLPDAAAVDTLNGKHGPTKSYDFSSEVPGAFLGLHITEDGSKCFALDDNDIIYSFNLTTAHDIRTATLVSSFDLNTVFALLVSGYGFHINATGTELYVSTTWTNLGTQRALYQFTFGTAWDVSTLTFTSGYNTIDELDEEIRGIALSADGLKLYIVKPILRRIYQYTLSTAWLVSSASYDSVFFSMSAQITSPYDLHFNAAGTKFWVTGNTNKALFQYTLTAWDLSTAAYDSKTLDVSSETTSPVSNQLTALGANLYVGSASGKTVYQYDVVTPEDISTAFYGTGLTLTVASITGFSDGDYIGIILVTGAEHQTTIDGSPAGSSIVISDALPGIAADGAAVVKALDLNGSATIPVAILVYPSDDAVVFSNFVDAPQVYDRASCAAVSGLPSGGDTEFRTMITFLSRLFTGHQNEGGTDYPRRYRWCAAGDMTDWSGGDTGSNNLLDTTDYIMALTTLAHSLVIYRQESISRGVLVNRTGELLAIQQMIDSEGAISPRAVLGFSDHQVFMSLNGIFRYTGGLSVERLSDAIDPMLFGTAGELDPASREMVFTLKDVENRELLFAVPSPGNAQPAVFYRYQQVYKSWLRREFSKNFSGQILYKESSSLTWAAATGTWGAYNYPWNSRSFQSNSPLALLLGTDGQVYEYSPRHADDDGTPIDFYGITKDFMYPDGYIQVGWVSLLVAGVDASLLTIDYSLDLGTTWALYGIVTLSQTSLKQYRLNRDVAGPHVRFRFSGSFQGFQLGSFSFMYRQQTLEV